MLNRLKQAMVESFVGAIGLGWLFGQIILYLVNIVAAPVDRWFNLRFVPGTLVATEPPLLAAFQEPGGVRFSTAGMVSVTPALALLRSPQKTITRFTTECRPSYLMPFHRRLVK